MATRGATKQVKCKCGCGVVFLARVADIKRGWGKFASKSCKAREQTRRTGISGPTGARTARVAEYNHDYDDDDEYWSGASFAGSVTLRVD